MGQRVNVNVKLIVFLFLFYRMNLICTQRRSISMVLIFQESFLWVRDYMITVSEFDILSISKNSFAPIYTQSIVTYAAL